MNNKIWEAAEFETEWNHDGLRYKLFTVPREAIDEDSDECPAHLIIGIDDGNVRRIEQVIDIAYGRFEQNDHDFIEKLLAHKSTPDEAIEILNEYI